MPAATPIRPVVVRQERRTTSFARRLIPAAILSALFHAALIGLTLLAGSPSQAQLLDPDEARAAERRKLREAAHAVGATDESDAAVERGLVWLAKNQQPDGKWQLDGKFPDKGQQNDIAGTAFGLLPFLGAGKSHKAAKDNPYDRNIEKGLVFLIRRQDKRSGNFGGGMYAHGLGTLALCEAYGLSQDPLLRRPAQLAVNYIVMAQHTENGGWRYTPGQKGDTSVTGWQVTALQSAQRAGLDVPQATLKKVAAYLDAVCGNEGYGYVDINATPTMSAVGLLCRQRLEGWSAQNMRLQKGIENHLKPTQPGASKNIYYYFYATQVMYHFGGDAWKDWNEKMREQLIKTQVRTGPETGSWNSTGDAHGSAGGRMMVTSLSLLTLEIYYRPRPK